MSTIPSATDYDVNSKSYICTNPECPECHPGYGGFQGKKVSIKCWKCGKLLTEINGEPYGTPHSH